MNTQRPTDARAQPSAETERVLKDFVRAAVSFLADALKNESPETEEDSVWERGVDGHFRQRTTRSRSLWPTLSDEWLRSLPDYDTCVTRLRSDVIVGPHLDHLVGTRTGASRFEVGNLLQSLIYAMLDHEGVLAFSDESLDRKWQEMVGAFCSDQIPIKTIAPLPHLVVPFPLRLSSELVLDRLTDTEVTRCCQVGVLRPMRARFPLIDAGVAVGIRRTSFSTKLIRTGAEPDQVSALTDEGTFGSRPLYRDDLVIDDVLSAMRLFKHAQVHAAGNAQWSDSFWLQGSTSYRVLRQSPYWGTYQLSESEVPAFLDLWRLLESGARRFGFSIHRFNLAFDRGLLADRLVDLIIAAESLFLGDLDARDRGELRFRFALRAGKFIEHPHYGEHDLFRVMRRAYDARSAVVHGGSPKDTSLPDNKFAELTVFIDTVEELVRLGLRKALAMKDEGKRVRESDFWDSLVLSKPKS